MNEAIRRAAGRMPEPNTPDIPGEDASDEQIAAWVDYVRNRPKPAHGSADGGAGANQGPRPLTASQRFNAWFFEELGWRRRR